MAYQVHQRLAHTTAVTSGLTDLGWILFCVQALGDWVLRPFLQDTIQFWPLTAAMTGTLFTAPLTIARVLVQVWELAFYTIMHDAGVKSPTALLTERWQNRSSL